MYSMNEALAREQRREVEARSRQAQLAKELAAEHRWQRVSRWARAAESRHRRRARELAVH